MSTLQTLDQRIVAALHPFQKELADGESRSESLPLMLHRHGLMQTIAFLESKENSDQELANCLRTGIAATLATAKADGNTTSKKEKATVLDYSAMGFATYALHQEMAIRVATWMKRIASEEEKKKLENKGTPGAAGKRHS